MPIVEKLLSSAGYVFILNNKVHVAYYYLIIYHNGKSISECNEVLASWGIEEENWLIDNSK